MSQSEVFAGKPGSDFSGAGRKIFNQLPVATCNPFQRDFLTRIVANRQGDAFGSFEQSVEESHPFRMLHVFELQSKHCLEHKPSRSGLCRRLCYVQIERGCLVHVRCCPCCRPGARKLRAMRWKHGFRQTGELTPTDPRSMQHRSKSPVFYCQK
jgi:hypothetical protein